MNSSCFIICELNWIVFMAIVKHFRVKMRLTSFCCANLIKYKYTFCLVSLLFSLTSNGVESHCNANGVFHPASRAFLLLARFWRSRERLCMSRVRSLLNMRCMLPGYSLEPKPNMPDLTAFLVFHGTAGSIIAIGFVTKRTLALEKPVSREKTRLTSPEARAEVASKS